MSAPTAKDSCGNDVAAGIELDELRKLTAFMPKLVSDRAREHLDRAHGIITDNIGYPASSARIVRDRRE